jgi:hypothetical protein
VVAEIVHGEADWADILFLAAAILAFVAAVSAWPERRLVNPFGWAAVSALAIGWLLL